MSYSTIKLGPDSKVYVGTAGSTAGTLLAGCRDSSINISMTTADAGDKDDGWEDEVLISRKITANLNFLKKDTNLAARNLILDAAANSATGAIALKIIDSTDGTVYDFDALMTWDDSHPRGAEQVVTSTATRTGAAGRGVSIVAES